MAVASKQIDPEGYTGYGPHPFWGSEDEPQVGGVIPPGGSKGQVLAKSTDADYQMEWVDQTGGGGGTGPAGPPGEAATIEVGVVDTLPPDMKATVVNTGTNSHAVFSFAIPQGKDGAPGPAGATGATGPVGPAGADGKDGAPGPAGPTGATGPVGPAGADGKDGAPGPAGPTGATGPSGEDGGYYQPSVSADGELSFQASKAGMPAVPPVNIRGPQGLPGEKGNDGQDGATGPQGLAGQNGGYYQPSVSANGVLTWAASQAGMPAVGSVNIAGPRGGTGPQGPAGQAATVEVGTVTTLPAGSQATVTNSGTAQEAVLNFGIPQGEDGAGGGGGVVEFEVFDETFVLDGAFSAPAISKVSDTNSCYNCALTATDTIGLKDFLTALNEVLIDGFCELTFMYSNGSRSISLKGFVQTASDYARPVLGIPDGHNLDGYGGVLVPRGEVRIFSTTISASVGWGIWGEYTSIPELDRGGHTLRLHGTRFKTQAATQAAELPKVITRMVQRHDS